MKSGIVAIIEGPVADYDSDDGGIYLSTRLSDPKQPLYVDIKSAEEDLDGRRRVWDRRKFSADPEGSGFHKEFLALIGKRVRVTIEVLE